MERCIESRKEKEIKLLKIVHKKCLEWKSRYLISLTRISPKRTASITGARLHRYKIFRRKSLSNRKLLMARCFKVIHYFRRLFSVIECEKIDNLTDPNLRIAVLSRQVGGEIMFSCMQGFGLNGPTHSTCLPSGEWEQPFPTCAGLYLTLFDRLSLVGCLVITILNFTI